MRKLSLFLAVAIIFSAVSFNWEKTASAAAGDVTISGVSTINVDYGKTTVELATIKANAAVTIKNIETVVYGNGVLFGDVYLSANPGGVMDRVLQSGESIPVALTAQSMDQTGGSYMAQLVVTYDAGSGDETVRSSVVIKAGGDTYVAPTPIPTPTPPPLRPSITATAPSLMQIKANETIKVAVTLKNTSAYDAEDVRFDTVNMSGMAVDVQSSNVTRVGAGNTVSVNVSITVDKTIAAGIHNIPIKGSFRSADGAYEGSFAATISIQVAAAAVAPTPTPTPAPTPTPKPGEPRLSVEITGISNENIVAGDSFVITGLVRNNSRDAAKNVTVNAGIADKGIGIWNASYDKSLGDIAGNSQVAFSYEFRADKDAVTGNYIIKFSAAGENDLGSPFKSAETSYSARVTGIAAPTPSPTPTPAPTLAPDQKKPALIIDDFKVTSDNINAGDKFTVSATVKNISRAAAPASFVIADCGDIEMDGSPLRVNLGEIQPGGTATFSFNFAAPDDVKSGSKILTFTAYSYDIDGAEVSSVYRYPVRVTGKPASVAGDTPLAVVEFSSVTSPSGSYDVGETFSIAATITNRGKTAASGIKITAAPDKGLVPKSSSVVAIDSLSVGESRTVTFSFTPTADVEEQFHTIEITAEYTAGVTVNGDGALGAKITDKTSQYAGVDIINTTKKGPTTPENNKSVPKIIVSNYKVNSGGDPSDIVLAGKEFDLFLQFKNTHPTKTISNIKIVLSTPVASDAKGNTFSVVGGSNTIYIDEIKPQEVYEVTLRMESLLSAAAKNHIISIDFQYEDEEGNAISQKEDVGVTVTQDSKMEIGDIYVNNMMAMGERQYLWFSVQNTGRVTLYNVKVKLSGEGFDVGQSEVIWGNMASGANQYYDGSFTAQDVGMHTLTITIQYDLDTGKRVLDEHEYTIEVVPGFNDGFNDGMGGAYPPGGDYFEGDGNQTETKPEGFFQGIWYEIRHQKLWVKIAVPAAAAAVIGGTVAGKLIARKRRRRQQYEDEEQ